MHPSRLAHLRKFRRGAEGSTIVEFALIAPVVIMLVLAVVEVSLMMVAQGLLDRVAFVASRVGKTGYSQTGSTQDATVWQAVTKAASDYLDTGKIVITSKSYLDYDKIGQPEPFTDLNSDGKRNSNEPFSDVNGNGTYDSDQGKAGYGSTGSVSVYTVTYKWKTFTPYIGRLLGTGGVVDLKSLIVVKNEPY